MAELTTEWVTLLPETNELVKQLANFKAPKVKVKPEVDTSDAKKASTGLIGTIKSGLLDGMRQGMKEVDLEALKGSNKVSTTIRYNFLKGIKEGLDEAGTEGGKAFTKSVEKETSKATRRAGDKAGSSFLGGFNGLLAKGAALTGVASLGLSVGSILTKGWDRLQAIDDARAKLAGLGNDAAAVDTIMKSALDSVKGTAFGLDEAATTAASAVAAGIKPGEELTKYLKNVADAAGIAGSSMGDMGHIFNKVQTSGKAMTDDLNQLSDRGIPIFEWLKEEYKVSGQELSKMVEKGAVDSATFQKVIGEHIGGAALTMSKSTSGSFANLNAALSRFGAALVAPVFNQAAGVFTKLTGVVDNMTTALGPTMEKVGGILGGVFDKVTPMVTEFTDSLGGTSGGGGIGGIFSRLGEYAKQALPALQDIGKTFMGFLGSVWDTVKSVLPNVKVMFKQVFESVRGIIATVGPPLAKAIKPIIESLGRFMKSLAPVARVVVSALGLAFKGLAAVLGPVAKILLNVIGAVLPKIIDAISWVVTKITQFGPALAALWTGLKDRAVETWNDLVSDLKAIGGFLVDVWNGVVDAASAAWDGIKAGASAAWDFLKLVGKGMVDFFMAPGRAAIWLWKNAIVPAWDGIKTAFSIAWDFIKDIFEKLKTGFDVVKGVFLGIAQAIGNGVRQAFNGLADIIKAPLRALGSFLAGIPDKIGPIEIPFAPTLKKWGQNLQGLASGGVVRGPGTGTSDSILAWLSNGEGVVTAKGMKNGGNYLVAALNAGWSPPAELLHQMFPGFAQGLNPGADYLRSTIMQKWPQITNIGGRRNEDGFGEHSSGNAIDIMIPNWNTDEGLQLGNSVAAFLTANKDALNLDGYIWRQASYGYGGGSFSTGKPMENRGSPTQNHMDHLHVILGKGRGVGATPVGMPTSALSGGSGGGPFGGASFMSGGSRISSSGGGSVTAKQLREAQDRVTDKENALTVAEQRLGELESAKDTEQSTLTKARSNLEKSRRELEQAKQDQAELSARAGDNAGGSPGFGADQFTKQAAGNSSDWSEVGKIIFGGMMESIGFDGSLFKSPFEFPMVKSAIAGINAFAKPIMGMASGGGGGSSYGVPGIGGGDGDMGMGVLAGIGDAVGVQNFLPQGGSTTPGGPTAGNAPVIDMSGSQFGWDPATTMDKVNQKEASISRRYPSMPG